MHDVRLLSVGLQYVTFRLIKHVVDGRTYQWCADLQLSNPRNSASTTVGSADGRSRTQTTTTNEHCIVIPIISAIICLPIFTAR